MIHRTEACDMLQEFEEVKDKDMAYDYREDHEEDVREESFWKKLAKLFYSLAMFNAINKHY